MAQRGVMVSHETVRQWCRSLGRPTPSACADAGVAQGTSDTSTRYSSRSTLRSTICGGRWTSTGTSWTFWSPPDETPRPRPSSSKLLTRLEYVLRALVSDKLASDQAARRRALRSVEHRQSKYLNNRAQNFHQPTEPTNESDEETHLARHTQRLLSGDGYPNPAHVHLQRDNTALPATDAPPRNTGVRDGPASPPETRSRARPRRPPERCSAFWLPWPR
jgi:putative transposase